MVLEWKPKNKEKVQAFKEFHLQDGAIIGVFQGSKGKNPELDIVVKYKDKFTKRVVRTPKHIHWVIDLLIKKEHDRDLTLEFINYLFSMYDKIQPFKNKAEQQKCELKFTIPGKLKRYDSLNASTFGFCLGFHSRTIRTRIRKLYKRVMYITIY